jgi:glycosyltransferase involved in cell wall biosynthesis
MYFKKMKMDIVLLTYNSVEPCLDKTLHSILIETKRADIIPRLIVVDKNSTDGTKELVIKYGKLNPRIINDPEGTRATARQIGIENVETPYFMFIDSDVILNEGWFLDAFDYFNDSTVGALWGLVIPISEDESDYKEAMSKFHGLSKKELTLKYAKIRGLTHDTLIKTETVKGIKIPPELHAFEDHFIRLYVEKKGYKWINSEDTPSCLHYRHERTGKHAYIDAYYGYHLGVFSKTWFIKHIILAIPKLTYLMIKTKNIKVLKVEAIKEVNILKAALTILYKTIYN